MDLNKKQLEILFSLGLLTEEEKIQIYKKYKASNSILDVKSSFIDILEKSIKLLDDDILKTKTEIENYEKKRQELEKHKAKSIVDSKKELTKALLEDIANENIIQMSALEKYEQDITRLDRKMDQKFHEDIKKLEEYAIQRIRSKIS